MVYKSFKLQQQYDAGITIADDMYCNDNNYVISSKLFLHASDTLVYLFIIVCALISNLSHIYNPKW